MPATLAALALAVTGFWLYRHPSAPRLRRVSDAPAAEDGNGKASQSGLVRVRGARHHLAGMRKRARPAEAAEPKERPTVLPAADEQDSWSPQAKALGAKLQDALDSNSFKDVQAIAKQILKLGKGSEELRQKLIEALGWFGSEALEELTSLMFDPDPETAAAAQEEWKNAVKDIEDPSAVATLLQTGLTALPNTDELDEMILMLDALPQQYTVSTLVNLIEDASGTVRNAAKEHYKFVTGEDYTTPDAADAWLKENDDDSAE